MMVFSLERFVFFCVNFCTSFPTTFMIHMTPSAIAVCSDQALMNSMLGFTAVTGCMVHEPLELPVLHMAHIFSTLYFILIPSSIPLGK